MADCSLSPEELDALTGEDEEYRRWLLACQEPDSSSDDADCGDGGTAASPQPPTPGGGMDVDDPAAEASAAAAAAAAASPQTAIDDVAWQSFNLIALEDFCSFPQAAAVAAASATPATATGSVPSVVTRNTNASMVAAATVSCPGASEGLTGVPPASACPVRECDLAVRLLRLLQGLPAPDVSVETVPTGAGAGASDALGSCSVLALRDEVVVEGLSPAALRGMAAPILRAAATVRKVRAAVAALRTNCPTPYSVNGGSGSGSNGVAPLVPALSGVLLKAVQCCTNYFAEVEAEVRRADGSLFGGQLPWQQQQQQQQQQRRRAGVAGEARLANLAVVARVLRSSGAEGWLACCEKTARLAQSLTRDRYGATVLLSRLYRDVERQRGTNSPSASLSYCVFLTCLRPYIEEIGAWVSLGRLSASLTREPMLFVAETGRSARATGADPYSEWDTQWSVNAERLPCFISPALAQLVLSTGKSVRFLSTLRSKLLLSSIKTAKKSAPPPPPALPPSAAAAATVTDTAADACHVPRVDFYTEFLAAFRLRCASASAPTSVPAAGGSADTGADAPPPARLTLQASVPGVFAFDAARMRRIHGELLEAYGSGAVEGLTPLSVGLREAVDGVAARHAAAVGDSLVRSLQTHCDMRGRLAVLRGVFLLQRGDVMQHFCRTFLFPVARRADRGGRRPPAEEMQAHFRSAWLVAKASPQDAAQAATLHCRWEADDGNVACLRFSPGDDTPRLPLGKPPPPESLRVVSSFALDAFSHAGGGSPMNVVFPHAVTQAYTRLLQVLLTVAYAQHLLVSMRLPKMARKPSPLEKRIIAAKLHLLHFIQALNDHFLQKTGAIWEAGMKEVAKAADIESFRRCHKELAHALLDAVNFSCRHREHWTTVLSVVKLVIRFVDCTHGYIEWMRVCAQCGGDAAGEAELLQHANIDVQHLKRTLPQVLDAEVMSQFRRHMQFFVATLRTHGVGSSSANVMLARFDFNGVYSARQ